ncbi:MAG: YkuS family protein [Christensenellales bacterium]|jgi:hypothetical protein
MVVAYQKGLERLAYQLQRHGYEVVPYEESRYADALVYSQSEPGLLNSVQSPNGSLFLVNAHGRSFSEVMDMLKFRTYSPLF